MSKILEQIYLSARKDRRRILLPEPNDPRVIAAAKKLVDQQLADVFLIDPPASITLPAGVQAIAVDDAHWQPLAAQRLYRNRAAKGLTSEAAVNAARDPIMFASLLLALDFADAVVAGSIATTAHVLRSGLHAIGTPPGRSLVSSFFLMQSPTGDCFAFADCAVVPDPTSEQLAEIARTTADNFFQLTGTIPRVALLSFSTKGSADHPAVAKIQQATKLLQSAEPELLIDGELQFDAAWVPAVGQRKAPGSTVAGQANVLIFPDLNSGNIGYKIAERLGGFQAIGPIIQGLNKPLMDLSRGCSVDDIVNVAVIASRMAAAQSSSA